MVFCARAKVGVWPHIQLRCADCNACIIVYIIIIHFALQGVYNTQKGLYFVWNARPYTEVCALCSTCS